jgi:hypothetical protein
MGFNNTNQKQIQDLKQKTVLVNGVQDIRNIKNFEGKVKNVEENSQALREETGEKNGIN